MLKREDCKPGVEVVCINESRQKIIPFKDSYVKLGHIYTIHSYENSDNNHAGLEGIQLEEFMKEYPYDIYYLYRFKLRNKNELKSLFNVVDTSLDIEIKELELA